MSQTGTSLLYEPGKRWKHRSAALAEWNTARRQRIQLLWDIGRAIQGGANQRWYLEQVHKMLVLTLASEFQGFSRQLHDAAVDCFAVAVGTHNMAVEVILRERLTSGRDLSRGNPHSDALTRDFARLGLTLWPALETANASAAVWKRDVTKLIETRNAIAHSDEARRRKLQEEGHPLSAATVTGWHQALDSLAVTMDDVVSDYLSVLLGIARPW